MRLKRPCHAMLTFFEYLLALVGANSREEMGSCSRLWKTPMGICWSSLPGHRSQVACSRADVSHPNNLRARKPGERFKMGAGDTCACSKERVAQKRSSVERFVIHCSLPYSINRSGERIASLRRLTLGRFIHCSGVNSIALVMSRAKSSSICCASVSL